MDRPIGLHASLNILESKGLRVKTLMLPSGKGHHLETTFCSKTFPSGIEETMAFPFVMPDSYSLPHGDGTHPGLPTLSAMKTKTV